MYAANFTANLAVKKVNYVDLISRKRLCFTSILIYFQVKPFDFIRSYTYGIQIQYS